MVLLFSLYSWAAPNLIAVSSLTPPHTWSTHQHQHSLATKAKLPSNHYHSLQWILSHVNHACILYQLNSHSIINSYILLTEWSKQLLMMKCYNYTIHCNCAAKNITYVNVHLCMSCVFLRAEFTASNSCFEFTATMCPAFRNCFW